MITSTANQRIKQFRKLRNRKERKQTDLYYIEGLRIVGEALKFDIEIKCVIYAIDLIRSDFANEVIQKSNELNIEQIPVSTQVFEYLSAKENPQGLAAVCKQEVMGLSEIDLDQDPIWVALDRIQDPGNLGAILRTNDSVGNAGVILLDECTDPFDLSSIRASMGALFSQKIIKSNKVEFAKWKPDSGAFLVGTSDKGDLDYQALNYPMPMVLIMGSEKQGLADEYISLCDALVRIPMQGSSDSLNLAVATGVSLYEIYNQNRSRIG
ncbi:MAG: RNA methyltransferase [Anaerolineaceae bacterium]|nr:RNA methyltransferase [Anaerolineaceae bacterium]